MGLAANGLGHNPVLVAAALHIADLVETMMVV
jgi:hypothetical protein